MRDPQVFKSYFEENNKHLGLYYTQYIMDELFELLCDVQYRLGYPDMEDDGTRNSEWDARVEYIERLIE
jgi:hypothetical protein